MVRTSPPDSAAPAGAAPRRAWQQDRQAIMWFTRRTLLRLLVVRPGAVHVVVPVATRARTASARTSAVMAKLMTMAVSTSACGSGSA